MEQRKQILLIVSISSLLLSLSAEAFCVPRNTTTQIRSPSLPHRPRTQSPPHVSALPRRPSAKSPSRSPNASTLPRRPADANPTVFGIGPAVKAICEKTDYPSLCISSLAPFLANRDNPAAVLEIAIKAAVNYTGAALAKARHLFTDPSTPTMTKAYIADCLELYTDAVDNFNAAAHAIPSGDTGLMNTMLSAAISDFSTCEDGFAEASEESPLKEMESKLSHMTSNCLAIVALLP